MENITSSNPSPEKSTPETTSQGNPSPVDSTSNPTPANPGTQPKPRLSRDEAAAKIDEKVRNGEDLTSEDLEYFGEIQSHEVKKVADERDKFNGKLADESLEQAPTEEGQEGQEPVEQDPNAYAVPEDHSEIYKVTGAKNPQELASIIEKNHSRMEKVFEWKKETEAKLQQYDKNFENATDLLEAVVTGDEEAIAAAKELLVKAGRNPNKAMVIQRENYLTDAEYENAVRTQEELAAFRNRDTERELKDRQREADARASQIKHEVLNEVSAFAESAKDLGLTPAQARAVFNELETNGAKAKLPPQAAKFKAVYDIAVSKGLNFDDAYSIWAHKNYPTRVKEEVQKLTNPKLKPSVGLSGVQSKAPAAPGGKYTRSDVQKMIQTNDYPKEWTVTLSDGSKMLNPKAGAIPDYVSAIIEDLL